MTQLLTIDQFYENARRGTLTGLKCSSGHMIVPPRRACQTCGSEILTQTTLSGRGEIISFTEVYVKSKEFPLETPYVLAIVRLLEGGNLLGIVDRGSDFNLKQGTNVHVEFRQINKTDRWPRIFFVPTN